MSDAIQDVEKVASAATGVVSTAAGGILTGVIPYLMGALALLIFGLAGAVAFDHYVIIPHYEAQAKIATADLQTANAATAESNASQAALRNTVQQQNQQIVQLTARATAAETAAQKIGSAVARKPLRPPPTLKSADAVNAYLQSLRTAP